MTTIPQLIEQAYTNSKNKGFWDGDTLPNIPEKLALIHSEISEALEEYRSEMISNTVYYGPTGKPEGLGVELADACIRIFDLCGYLDINLELLILEKMKYNESRPYKHGKRF